MKFWSTRYYYNISEESPKIISTVHVRYVFKSPQMLYCTVCTLTHKNNQIMHATVRTVTNISTTVSTVQ